MSFRSRTPPLLARTTELESLVANLEGLQAGRGSSVFIEGEAGIGKTALVREAVRGAARRGFEILSGGAEELERDRPFGPFIGALGLTPPASDLRRARIAGLLVDSDHSGPQPRGPARAPELRFRIIDAIVELFEELSATARVVVALEDLHWADPSTLLTVKRLVPLVTQLPLMLLLTSRGFPRSTHLDRLVQELDQLGARRMVLGPLDPQSLSRLVEERFGASPGPTLRKQLRDTGGNPLFATELLNTLAAEDALEIGPEQVEARETDLLPSLRLTILRRISFLDDGALEVLKVASVLGSSFSVRDLSLVMKQPVLRLGEELKKSLRAGLIDENADSFVFRHEVIREAVYLDLPLAIRAGLHLEIARALAAAGDPPLKVAAHFAVAAPIGDQQAVEWLRAAAQQANTRDPFTAVSLLEKARDLMEEAEESRSQILVELLVALTWSGREGDAVRLAEELLMRDHPPPIEVTIRMSLANALFFQNRMAESAEQCELASRLPELPDPARAALLGRLSAARIWADDLEQAAEVAAQAVREGERVDSDLALCLGLTNGGWVSFLRGHEQEAIDACSRSAQVALRTRDDDAKRAIMAHNSFAFVLTEADRLHEAEESLRNGRRVGDQVGRVWDLPLYHSYRGLIRYFTGQWDEAVGEFETGVTLAEEVKTRLGGLFPFSMQAVIAVHRDNLAAAEAALAAGAGHAERWGAVSIELYYDAWARALLLEARARPEDALRHLKASWDEMATLGVASCRRLLGPDLVRLAVLKGDHELAESVAQAVEEMVSLGDGPSLRGAALLCRGLLEDGPDALLEAVAAYRESPRLVEKARSAEEAGRALFLAARPVEGKALLGEAVETYERIGAVRDEARVNSFLRSQGIRRGSRKKHRAARVGWDALTPTEKRVTDLVAEGLSNSQIAARLFISRHTVESHVSHVLTKIGASSRVELAAQWFRRKEGIEPLA